MDMLKRLRSRWSVGTDECLALRAVVVGSLARSHAVRHEAAAAASANNTIKVIK